MPEAKPQAQRNEPTADDVVYICIIRSRAPKDGHEAVFTIEAAKAAGVEATVPPHVLAIPLREATASHHQALRQLGFVDWTANDHFPVVDNHGLSQRTALDAETREQLEGQWG